jgi:hypothetical protein
MSEMIQTERDYSRSLQYVIENYIPELQRVDVPQSLRGKKKHIILMLISILSHAAPNLHETLAKVDFVAKIARTIKR